MFIIYHEPNLRDVPVMISEIVINISHMGASS